MPASPPAWLVIADDLTGACDTGAVFARRGLRVVVQLAAGGAPVLQDGDVLVVSTDSRYLSEDQAAQAVLTAVPTAVLSAARPNCQIYKKVDSTLRGHPGAELRAVMRPMKCPLSSTSALAWAMVFPSSWSAVR